MAHSVELWEKVEALIGRGESFGKISKITGISKGQISKRNKRQDFPERISDRTLNPNKEVEEKRIKYGSVYIIKAGQKNIYKIGVAVDVGNRLKGMQTSHYEELKIIRTFYSEDVYSLEKRLHQKFTDKGQHIRGEWFNLDNEDISEIERYVYGS